MEQPPHRHGLVDTDILIDASRGIDQAGEFLNEIKRHVGISVSVISAVDAELTVPSMVPPAEVAAV